jgi:hypothetical protein
VGYPVSALSARYGASVAEETDDWRQAYAEVERFRRERPPYWARVPWAQLTPRSGTAPIAARVDALGGAS